MTSKRFIIGDVLGFGWQTMAANLWFFVGLCLLAGVFSFVPSLARIIVEHSGLPDLTVALINLPFQLIGIIISVIIGIGFTKIGLSFCDARKPSVGTLFAFTGCFWRYLGGALLYALIVMAASPLFLVPLIVWLFVGRNDFLLLGVVIGYFLFLIPAIFLAIKFSLWRYFVVDKGLGPIQALKASSRTTMGVKWQLFGFSILCGLIVMLGYMVLIVGVFAAYPIVLVANALVYRHLLAQTPELAEFNIDTTYSAAAQQNTVT